LKLLFDQNLSPALVQRLTDLYPGSAHVFAIGLDRASDLVFWNVARDQGYMIVSRDADFSELSAMLGCPPKVVWIRRGNCPTREIEAILRLRYDAMLGFQDKPDFGVLALL
jgi:predicted nuclease of predicted toxin-antitoxin system